MQYRKFGAGLANLGPNGVNIPRNLELYNQAAVYGNASLSKALYNNHTPKGERADACMACGGCEERGISPVRWKRASHTV